MNLYKIWRDIINYIFLLKQLKKLKLDPKWKQFKLNIGYVGQIWTVVNLKKEDMGETVDVQRVYVIERTKVFAQFLADTTPEIKELLLKPELKKIKGTYGWLVIFWPRSHYVSMTLVFRWILGIIGLSLLFHYFPIWDGIIWSWDYIWNFFKNININVIDIF